jgi:hypothetical protein
MSDPADGTWLRPTATWLAVACVVLVLINAALLLRNQTAQGIVNQRQQAINQAVPLARASQLLIETTAKIAVASKDDALMGVLEHHGIKVNVGPAQEKKP